MIKQQEKEHTCSECGFSSDNPRMFEGDICIFCIDDHQQGNDEDWEYDDDIY
jgi:hypothetical protein